MKLFTMLLALTLFNFAKYQSDSSSESCYQLEENHYSFFATKTAYSLVSNKQNYTQPANCKPLQLWLLSRHGTRLPAGVNISEMYKLYEYRKNLSNKSTLCQKDIEAIKAWSFNLNVTDGYKLHSQGVFELSSFGLRLKHGYKDIFDEPYNSATYKVVSSPESRAIDSASAFLKSAFNISNVNIPTFTSDDIRFNILKMKTLNDEDFMRISKKKEVQQFINSIHVQRVIIRVSKSLGLDQNLTYKMMKILYRSCKYENAWNINSRPPWCAVFSKEDLEVLEYEEDLMYYYLYGYGYSFNERLGCPIVKDLITNFRKKAQTQLGPKGIFYFGHTTNMVSTIVRLGLAKDSYPLLSSNFEEMKDRKWKLSKLCPFASNIMAVLYECPSGKKVTFFNNEIPVVVEKFGCTLCPWELIESMFDPIISSPLCTFDETSSASVFSKTIVLFFLTFLLNVLNFY